MVRKWCAHILFVGLKLEKLKILGSELIQENHKKIIQAQTKDASLDVGLFGDKVKSLKYCLGKGAYDLQTGKFDPSNLEPFKAVPLDGLHLDDKLHFVEEPIEIVDREVKREEKSDPIGQSSMNLKRADNPADRANDDDDAEDEHLAPAEPAAIA
ncbi:hypothetical protein Tco_0462616 [Tanacetum coccineum]